MQRFGEPLQSVRLDKIETNLATANRDQASRAAGVIPISRFVGSPEEDAAPRRDRDALLPFLNKRVFAAAQEVLCSLRSAAAHRPKFGELSHPCAIANLANCVRRTERGRHFPMHSATQCAHAA